MRYVIHTTMGVSEVIGKETFFIDGASHSFIVIRPLKDNKTYYAKFEYLRSMEELK